MKWKKRKSELERLRKKYPVYNVIKMPDLRVPGPKYPSMSTTGVARIADAVRTKHLPPSHLIVDTLHKQGPMVLSRSELPWAGGKKS